MENLSKGLGEIKYYYSHVKTIEYGFCYYREYLEYDSNFYFRNGNLHRENNPAVKIGNRKEWWIYGKFIKVEYYHD